jgi:hypothetical protein
VAGNRNEDTKQRDYTLPALAIAREIGAQDALALCLFNLAATNIVLGELTVARTELHEGLALALRLGGLPRVITALIVSGDLACAEGQVERALALWGLARNHPAWSNGDQQSLDQSFTLWKIDPSVAEAGMKRGEALDWDETVRELLK